MRVVFTGNSDATQSYGITLNYPYQLRFSTGRSTQPSAFSASRRSGISYIFFA